MNVDALKRDLDRDEDVKLKPYRDTVGKLTIGCGRNLDDRGISYDEAMYLLDNDIRLVFRDLDHAVPFWQELSEPRQRALANMMFNLGLSRFMGFKKMLAALAMGDYDTAAREALDSLWSRQVGQRAVRIADMIREG